MPEPTTAQDRSSKPSRVRHIRASSHRSSRSRRRPQIYFAAPLDTMGAPAHRKALAAARRQFSGYRIIDPSRLCWNTAEWLAEWPKLIPQLDALSIFPREDGTVGAGCFREIADARAAGIPVWVFSSEAQAFRPLQRMRRLNWRQRSMVYYARVHAHTGEVAASAPTF
jgi:hypothetical protein